MSLRASALFLCLALVCGCAPRVGRPMICLTEDLQGGEEYYLNGTPILVFESTQASASISISPAYLGTTMFMKVDISLLNISEDPFIFDPGSDILLEMTGSSGTLPTPVPLPPHRIQNAINQESAEGAFLTRLAGAISGAAHRSQGEYVAAQYTEARSEDEARAIRAEGWEYSQSVVYTMLKKNTVFPGETITGQIYFALPRHTRAKNIIDATFDLTVMLAEHAHRMSYVVGLGEWDWTQPRIKNTELAR